MKNNNSHIEWYNSGNNITSLIIGIIALIILCSQSFAIGSANSLDLFRSVINHNSIYLLVIIYFIALKSYFGKRNFNYLNLFLMIIYLLATITSLLTIVQSFSLNTIISFSINLIILIYLFHTMFRDTRVWKDYKLGNSPFNEISNELYFYIILVLSLFLLTVNLISTVIISGVIIAILDTIYIILFARYIFLYREFLDSHKKDVNNSGNFDEIKETIKNTMDNVNNKVNEIIEESEIDEKIDKIKEDIIDTVDNTRKKLNEVVLDTKKEDKEEKSVNNQKKVSKSTKSKKKKGDNK